MSTATGPPRQPSISPNVKPFVPLDVPEHVYAITWHNETYYRYECTCTFATAWWSTQQYPNPENSRAIRRGCPFDPTVQALITLQFANGGLFNSVPADYLIHLVRSTNRGNPGPTLCGIERSTKGGPGWSVGGGVSGGPIVLNPCEGCAGAARDQFPGLPVSGSIGGAQMAEHLGVQHSTFPW